MTPEATEETPDPEATEVDSLEVGVETLALEATEEETPALGAMEVNSLAVGVETLAPEATEATTLAQAAMENLVVTLGREALEAVTPAQEGTEVTLALEATLDPRAQVEVI